MVFGKARLAHYAEKANKQSGSTVLLQMRPTVSRTGLFRIYRAVAAWLDLAATL